MILDKILELCERNDTNLSKLERETGLSNATIRRWAVSSPSIDNLQKVADYFKVSIDHLACRNGYEISEEARMYALQYEALPNEKKDLVRCYISVMKAG